MTELFDAIYVDPKDNNGEKRGLINELGDAAADYCFDEAWLDWLERKRMLVGQFGEIRKTLYGKNGKRTPLAVACAANEIGEKLYKQQGDPDLQRIKQNPQAYFGYASDGGSVQRNTYIKLSEKDGGTSIRDGYKSELGIEYCKDVLTNFYYVAKTALYFMDPEIYSEPSTGSSFGTSGPHMYRQENCFLKIHAELVDKMKNLLGYVDTFTKDFFEKELTDFAENSASLGNYGCIPKRLSRIKTVKKFCNPAKSGGLYIPLIANGEKKQLNVNDQMALFVEWIELNTTKSEKRRVIEPWKDTMLFDGLVWDYYKDAALAYKSAFASKVLDDRIAQFAEYLRCINNAIELRSKLIVEKIGQEMREEAETQA